MTLGRRETLGPKPSMVISFSKCPGRRSGKSVLRGFAGECARQRDTARQLGPLIRELILRGPGSVPGMVRWMAPEDRLRARPTIVAAS